MFKSDSEYEGLLLIQTPLSYKLNQTTLGNVSEYYSMVAEVIEVTERVYTMETLNDLMVKVVDETLRHVFKEEGTKAIFGYLENNSHLIREEIVEKPEVFSTGLERLMVSAAQVIEKMILINLYGKLGFRFREREGYEFSDYVRELRKGCGC